MKRHYLITINVLSVLTFSLFLSCNQGEKEAISMTNADRLVVSSEYQLFSNEVSNFTYEIYQVLSTLSPKKKEQLDKICLGIKTSDNSSQTQTLMQQLQSLMGEKYIKKARKISELSEKICKNQTFTPEELTKAIRKYQFTNKVNRQTKALGDIPSSTDSLVKPINPIGPDTTSTTPSVPDSTTTVPSTPTQDLLEACLSGCQNSYQISDIVCSTHTHKTENEKEICRLERYTTLVVCIEDCKKKYSSPVPPTTTN